MSEREITINVNLPLTIEYETSPASPGEGIMEPEIRINRISIGVVDVPIEVETAILAIKGRYIQECIEEETKVENDLKEWDQYLGERR